MHLAVGALKPAVRLEQEGLGGGGVYFHIEVFINVHGILEAFKQKLHTHTHTQKRAMTVVPLEYYFQTLNHCGVIFCIFYHFFFYIAVFIESVLMRE